MFRYEENGQLTLTDTMLDIKLPQINELPQKARSAKPDSALISIPYFHLDLASGYVDLFGCHFWEMRSPWCNEEKPLNTGVAPRQPIRASLSDILEQNPDSKYYLSKPACLGILRRASERGKELPEKLKRALEIQSGLRSPDGHPTSVEAFHINQRDEGIDLHGVSGTLMATTNMQMQTFVTDAGDTRYVEDAPIAFAANQRDEARDLHNVAGALGSQPGMKQQTFIAAGFSAGQGSKAGGIGYQEECAPTLKAAGSGTNMVPSVLCLNDQGGSVMECSINVTGTLRAQEHGHQPILLESNQDHAAVRTDGISPTLPASMGMGGGYVPMVYENHGIDSRYTGPHNVAPTMSARYGTGGNNVPLVEQEPIFCITGNAIDRQPQNGGNGIGYQEDIAYTLTATDHHAVFSRQRVDIFKGNDVVSTQSARQHKDATDLVYQETVGALTSSDCKGPNSQYVSQDKCVVSKYHLIRRLTPNECELLQGFPKNWTNINGASDSGRYRALGNSVAIPCVEFIMSGLALALRAG